jgi:hypothetical protein
MSDVITCLNCGGLGWTEVVELGHDPECDGTCSAGCPIPVPCQVQCQYCWGTGRMPAPAPSSGKEPSDGR